ncbi:MAG: ABC transporter permease [Acidobacteriota bacterium]|jgi:putative ABC transport system permease protein|nr:ABC transporter permease [Acidobacteriota bacterium]
MTGTGADTGGTVNGRRLQQWLPDVGLAIQNLAARKLRALLTMLGIIFGVAAVVSMMSIGAGAQQQVLAFIEQLGVRNLIVEAKEVTDPQELLRIRKSSPGLSFKDLRVLRTNVGDVAYSSARKRLVPMSTLPKPNQSIPEVYGVGHEYLKIAGLRLAAGRFFDQDDNDRRNPVCVLGDGAKENLFPQQQAVGQYLKINEQWVYVIGVLASQLTLDGDLGGMKAKDLNNVIYTPIDSLVYRFEGGGSVAALADEIDGIYLQFEPQADIDVAGDVVRGILDAAHRNANDFTLIVPAELLAEQRRTQRIFEMVLVAIASISLLVGGIGIMNIMLAGILERTHEIGVRRAVGARRGDILRQFLVEAVLISFAGGLLGVALGFGLSRLVALMAGWDTIVTPGSILLAFLVSVSVGLMFGIYPAAKAARLDPVEALRYE